MDATDMTQYCNQLHHEVIVETEVLLSQI